MDGTAATRLRILRAAAYRCGVRSAIGTLCEAPAEHVDAAYRYPTTALEATMPDLTIPQRGETWTCAGGPITGVSAVVRDIVVFEGGAVRYLSACWPGPAWARA